MDPEESERMTFGMNDPENEKNDTGELTEGKEIITPDHRMGRIDSIQDAQSGTDDKIIRVEILEGPDKGNVVDFTSEDFAQAA